MNEFSDVNMFDVKPVNLDVTIRLPFICTIQFSVEIKVYKVTRTFFTFPESIQYTVFGYDTHNPLHSSHSQIHAHSRHLLWRKHMPKTQIWM